MEITLNYGKTGLPLNLPDDWEITVIRKKPMPVLPDPSFSVRRALGGTDLDTLRDAVDHEFLALDAHEQSVRAVVAKLESGFLRRFANFQHE